MSKRISKESWKEFTDVFSYYEGTVTKFCKENNISKSQFYYHKKRFEEPKEPTFHAISFDKGLFVFFNKQINKLKIIHFDEGFWLYYYRLENNRFKWTMTREDALKINQGRFKMAT